MHNKRVLGESGRYFFLWLILWLVVTCGLVGCALTRERGPGAVRRWPARPWSEAFVYNTPLYTVKTNTSPDVAVYIGELMEKAAAGYYAVLGYKEASLPRFTIHAYATRDEYEAVVQSLGLPPDITSGLYSPVPPAAIHLPYIRDLKVHPSITLLHEGVHQFVDRTLRFRVPAPARSVLPANKHTLVGVPLWLNEGFASYMESAVVNQEGLEIGQINRKRLIQLQKLIRARKCPALRKVLSQPYGATFLADDYAVSWGIVYALRHSQGQPDSRKRLTRYVEACRQAFYTDPADFMSEFLPDMKPVEGFDQLWAARVGRRSLEVFDEIIVEEGSSLDAWEEDWRAYILRLKPRDPYGGLGVQGETVLENGSSETNTNRDS